MRENISISISDEPAEIPESLLLQADPSLEKIRAYLSKGKVWTAQNGEGKIIGVCVLNFEDNSAEIKNISIEEEYQGTGIGQRLLAAVKPFCQNLGLKSLTVRTGNSSIGQLAFYQKCGFEMIEIVPDYFIENYPEPIFENGIQCKHQIILRHEFTDI